MEKPTGDPPKKVSGTNRLQTDTGIEKANEKQPAVQRPSRASECLRKHCLPFGCSERLGSSPNLRRTSYKTLNGTNATVPGWRLSSPPAFHLHTAKTVDPSVGSAPSINSDSVESAIAGNDDSNLATTVKKSGYKKLTSGLKTRLMTSSATVKKAVVQASASASTSVTNQMNRMKQSAKQLKQATPTMAAIRQSFQAGRSRIRDSLHMTKVKRSLKLNNIKDSFSKVHSQIVNKLQAVDFLNKPLDKPKLADNTSASFLDDKSVSCGNNEQPNDKIMSGANCSRPSLSHDLKRKSFLSIPKHMEETKFGIEVPPVAAIAAINTLPLPTSPHENGKMVRLSATPPVEALPSLGKAKLSADPGSTITEPSKKSMTTIKTGEVAVVQNTKKSKLLILPPQLSQDTGTIVPPGHEMDPICYDSVFGPDMKNLLTPQQLFDRSILTGVMGIATRYEYLRSMPPQGTFNASRMQANTSKNRYGDVLCYDHTRVRLMPQTGVDSDYINANYVNGYKQKTAYICCQAPLHNTSNDFWRMVWQEKVVTIVMTTRLVEKGRKKCHEYWPLKARNYKTYSLFEIDCIGLLEEINWTITNLVITNRQTGERRQVAHLLFSSWPDYGLPSSAEDFLKFIATVKEYHAAAVRNLGSVWKGHPKGPPMIVHCSAGVGRTGTYLVCDICMNMMDDIHMLNIEKVLSLVRAQRALAVQTPEQYVFCHLALLQYAKSNGYVTGDIFKALLD